MGIGFSSRFFIFKYTEFFRKCNHLCREISESGTTSSLHAKTPGNSWELPGERGFPYFQVETLLVPLMDFVL